MDILHGAERVFGYLFIIFSLPLFVTLYALFASHLLSSGSFSNLVSSATHNALLAGLVGLWISTAGIFMAGLIAIAGAALIFFGSKEYSGLSKVGTEIVALSAVSIAMIYVILDYVLPFVTSKIGGLSASSISGLVSTIASPMTSVIVSMDIIFIVLGSAFIALRFILPSAVKTLSNRPKKNVNHAPSFWYRTVGLPIGIAVMIILLAFFTVFNTSLLSSVPTYSTTTVAANPVSLSYQNQTSSAGLENLSDYYFLTGPNENTTFNGGVGLSLSNIPLQFSLPLSLSVTKLGDPIRIDFNIDLSQISSILSSLRGKSNNSNSSSLNLPSNLKFTILYNSSGTTICDNLNSSQNFAFQCDYQPTTQNITQELLNINSSNANRSILGQLFNLPRLLTSIFNSGSNSNSPQSESFPTFTFVNNVNYNGNDCSLFYVNATSSLLNLTGRACISDSNGLPSFIDITLAVGSNGASINLNINFGVSSTDKDVTLGDVNSFPPGTIFVNGSQS